jgi:hypothetical protein
MLFHGVPNGPKWSKNEGKENKFKFKSIAHKYWALF